MLAGQKGVWGRGDWGTGVWAACLEKGCTEGMMAEGEGGQISAQNVNPESAQVRKQK